MNDFNEFREKMIKYRAKHNLSQTGLARLCNVTTQTICNIENGVQDPSNLTKFKILEIIEKKEEN